MRPCGAITAQETRISSESRFSQASEDVARWALAQVWPPWPKPHAYSPRKRHVLRAGKPRRPRLARTFDVDRPLYRGRVELSRRNRERRPPQSPHIGAQQAKDGPEQSSGSEMAVRRRWWWREVVRRHSPAEPSARDVDLHSCWLTLQRRSRCTRVCIAPEARCTRVENSPKVYFGNENEVPVRDFHR